jgi:flagellar protein FliO/FliZ
VGDAAAQGAPALPWFEAVLATLFVLGLLAATLWLLRRGLTRRSGQRSLMSVETSMPLGERRSIVVIEVEGRRLLVGMAPGHVQLLTELKPTRTE